MSLITDQLDSKIGRRSLLQMGGMATATLLGGGLLAGCGGHDHHSSNSSSSGSATDTDVLNFALNLEYLEAEYYLRATNGVGLTSTQITGSTGTAGATTGGRQVTFTNNLYRQFANELASDENNHVNFLRSSSALGGSAVAKPAINLGTVFNVLYQLATGDSTGTATFDPYNDEVSFLVGSFIFEDVGVTAYHGGSTLISNKATLSAAAGILAVEAYHAGVIRSLLAAIGDQPVPGASGNPTVFTVVNAISALRDGVDNNAGSSPAAAYSQGSDDQGIGGDSEFNLVPTDANSLAFSRTTTQVLNIVYGNANNPPTVGGFFPAGLNGTIK